MGNRTNQMRNQRHRYTQHCNIHCPSVAVDMLEVVADE
jgi:hypothetical protein